MRKILANIRRKPTVGTLREELSHVLLWGLYGFVGIFFIGALYSYGAAPDRRSPEAEEFGRKVDPVAQVGREKLTAKQWQDMLTRARLEDPQVTTMRHQQLGTMVDQWIRQEVQLGLARKMGVKVSGADLRKEIDKRVKEAVKGERGDMTERQWRYKLQKAGESAATHEGSLRKKFAENEDAFRIQLTLDKVKKAIENEIKITDKDLKEAYEEIEGRVILLRANAMRPPKPADDKKETPDEAKQRQTGEDAWRKALTDKKSAAEAVLKEIQANPARFEEIAKAKSDDYTKKDGGKLPAFTRENARFGEGFKKAVFDVPTGQVSGLLEGDDGWVVFKVEKRKVWPDDFKKTEPRSMEEALKQAQALYDQLQKGGDFAALAKDKSEDPGSGSKGGDLGEVTRGQMVKPFEKMAFALDKNEISKPFASRFGVHIVQVTDRVLPKVGETVREDEEETPDPDDKAKIAEQEEIKKLPLPKHEKLAKAKAVKARHILIKGEDPAKKIEEKRQQLEDRRKSEHFEKRLEAARKAGVANGSIRVFDNQLKSYMATKEYKPETQHEQMAQMRTAAQMWPTTHPDVHFELAKLYDQNSYMQDPKAQVAAAQALAKDAQGVPALVEALDGRYPEVRKAVCNALGELKAQAATAKLQDIVRNDADDQVAEAAKAALGKIGAKAPDRAKKAPTPPPPPPPAK
jgi:parvulin-like peptidyl-prolyl isomerase